MEELRYRLISKKYREYLLPTIAIVMANYMTTFVDSVLASTFLGVDKMPAIQLCFPVVALISFFHGMIGIGGSLTAADEQADHKRKEGNRVYSVSTAMGIGVGIAAAILGTIMRSAIIPLLCSDVSLQTDVGTYYSLLILGFPFICLLTVLSYYMRADGCPKMAFHVILVSNGMNLCMDVVLMKFLGMGLTGAALASIIGYLAGIIYAVIEYGRYPKRQFHFSFSFLSDVNVLASDLRRICTRGFGTASVWLYMMISVNLMNNLMLSYGGTRGAQAFSIGRNNLYLVDLFFVGISQTMSPIAGVYAHECDYDRVRFVLKRSIALVLAVAVVSVGLLSAFPGQMLLLYGAARSEYAAYFCRTIRLFALSYPGMAFLFVMNYYFQAINKRMLSIVVIILEQLILPVSLALLLTPSFGMDGVWAALIMAEVIPSVIVIVMILEEKRRTGGKKSFFLPAGDDDSRYTFTVEMKIPEIVRMAEEATRHIDKKLGAKTAALACLALEEMLTGIVYANDNEEDVIDVTLQETENDVKIYIKDMGVGFNPLIHDDEQEYSFDNAEVLQRCICQAKIQSKDH